MAQRAQTVEQWNEVILTLQGQISDLESEDRNIQEAIVRNQRELEANTRLDFPRLAAENQARITALEAERARVNQEIVSLDGSLQSAETSRDRAQIAPPDGQANAPPPVITPVPDNQPPTPLAADVELPPALAAAPIPASTGAVPVDVAVVPAPIVRPIVDPDIRTPPDLAVERAAQVAAVTQADSVGQGADTTLIVDRTIDPALGEGPGTLVAGQPLAIASPVDINQLPGGQEALFASATEPGAVDPEFAAELASLAQAEEAERQRFLLTDLPRPPDVDDPNIPDPFSQNPEIFEPGEIGDQDPEVAGLLEQQEALARADVAQAFNVAEPDLINPETDPAIAASFEAAEAGPSVSAVPSNTAAGATRALTVDAQRQNTLQQRVSLPSSADWRVRLSLAAGSTYLYNSSDPGILAPLAKTQGVVFPYMPVIETSYVAKYDITELTHSNYKGYFYKNSHVEMVTLRAPFTAQDTREAEYLLAVIHFFRSVTKMFYGAKDQLAGVPPPLTFLSGLGQYQFANHPCLLTAFQYTLPNDVDYIRANGFNNFGINLENRRNQSSGPPGTGIIGAIGKINRLLNNGLGTGSVPDTRQPGAVNSANSNTGATNSTYVPTKMELTLTLLPVQTRSQVSQQFNVRDFASGKLLKGGFW